ncbi:MAG: aspartate carbamoyltransferase catalytic subunit [Nitrospinae bacterium]|nr:aspartate carbamoyltransferase catalytic subunit [Nitrospinota bacterium]
MAEPVLAAFRGRHLLSISDLSADEISGLINTAHRFVEVSEREVKKLPTLRGKTVVNLFFEPSTRTRTSFEIAGKRLSADVINISAQSSSVLKGETFKDTVLNVASMNPDALVIRHPSPGTPLYASKIAGCSVINGGDGAHAHPTQALLDMMTIMEHGKSLQNIRVSIIGDVLHSRVARSNIAAFKMFDAKITVCGPKTLMPPDVGSLGVRVTHDISEAVREAEVIMMLRIQTERMAQGLFPSLREYSAQFCLDSRVMKKARPDAIVMHPGPINRGIEISSEVADGPYSVILDQVAHGVAMRMAVLYLLCGGAEQ